MADDFIDERGKCSEPSFAGVLADHIGETVTIFTASGGESGSGFTGVILSVNNIFVRLLTRIGPPPGCSLGNSCTGFNVGAEYGGWAKGGSGYGAGHCKGYGTYGPGPIAPANVIGAASAGGWNGYPVYTVGSVVDIPLANIVSFVHNAVR